MADSEPEISKEELQKQIEEILDHASLDKISTKKVIQQLEQKLGVDLSKKKTMIDQMVMDYVNDMESEDEGSMDDEEEVPAPPPKAVKKTKKQRNDDDDDEENDDSNDSDWGCWRCVDYVSVGDHGHLFSEESSDKNYQTVEQEPTITSSINQQPNHPRKAIVLKRVYPHCEDEADLFGKLTAMKLRRLPNEHRHDVMLQIDELLYDNIYL
nr:uncharacterized protein ZK546.14 isoform X2 [Helicoverpa armigera]